MAALLLVTLATLLPHTQARGAQPPPRAATAFVVDGIAEPLRRWQEVLRLVQSQNPTGTCAEAVRLQVLRGMIEGLAALHEAQQEGLTVSQQEVIAFTRQQQRLAAAHPETAAQVRHQARLLGLTLAQFWARQQETYTRDLLIGKLRARYYAHLSPSLTTDQKGRHWMEHLDQLARTATITITAPAEVL